MWAVRTGNQWLSLESFDPSSYYLCWGAKFERILFEDRDTAVRMLRASPWTSKKTLVHVSNH